jgi:hypothetical protein
MTGTFSKKEQAKKRKYQEKTGGEEAQLKL